MGIEKMMKKKKNKGKSFEIDGFITPKAKKGSRERNGWSSAAKRNWGLDRGADS
jgi:hypothetical protein